MTDSKTDAPVDEVVDVTDAAASGDDLKASEVLALASVVSPEHAQSVLADLTLSVRQELDDIRLLLED